MTTPAPPPDEFTYEQYLAAVAAVTAAFVATGAAIIAPFQGVPLSRLHWLGVLAALYPHVEYAREQASELARRFYDSERAKHVPPVEVPVLSEDRLFEALGVSVQLDDPVGLTTFEHERFDTLLAHYEPDWFEEAMEAARENFSREEATTASALQVLSVAEKEIENGGRSTLLEAVEKDRVVRGWARVAGGNESCSFCEMLISRGPVYKYADDAGFDTDNESAVEIWDKYDRTGDDELLDELMNRWHENCDCKVVPVFKGATTEWPGYLDYRRAEKLWGKVTKDYFGEDKMLAFRAYKEGREPPEPTRGHRKAA